MQERNRTYITLVTESDSRFTIEWIPNIMGEWPFGDIWDVYHNYDERLINLIH